MAVATLIFGSIGIILAIIAAIYLVNVVLQGFIPLLSIAIVIGVLILILRKTKIGKDITNKVLGR